jgi:hypothetical protein
MSYALVIDGIIQTEGGLPRSARRLDTGAWVLGLREYGTPDVIAACGYVEVVATPRPADTDTVTYDRTLELVDGVPTVVWVQRAYTDGETASKVESSNAAQIRTAAGNALDGNRTFLAIQSPTNAQVVAQVRALTRQNQGLIRLTLGLLDGVD